MKAQKMDSFEPSSLLPSLMRLVYNWFMITLNQDRLLLALIVVWIGFSEKNSLMLGEKLGIGEVI